MVNTATATATGVGGNSLNLLDVGLSPSTAIVESVSGAFTEAGQAEVACLMAGAGRIDIYRIVEQQSQPDDDDESVSNTPRMKLVCRVPTFSTLRSLAVLRFPGESRDVLAVGADAGTLAVLDMEHGACKIVHCVDLGKTGGRRSTPGQYVSADPQGRAIMVSATEKRKLVYVCNKDAQNRPTIASPLEAHRNRTITFDTVGLDNGYDNPIFASLELQYPDPDSSNSAHTNSSTTGKSNSISPNDIPKQVAYYELDLGLNHVSRKWATTVHRSACALQAVPGGAHGPGGVLVAAEDWIQYVHNNSNGSTNNNTIMIACAIPRRKPLNGKEDSNPVLITSLVVFRQKKSKFFGLAQSELGDVYKITLSVTDDDGDGKKVTGMQVALLDTLPVANSLNVNKLGMLFGAFGTSNHLLCQFERIDLPDAPTSQGIVVDIKGSNKNNSIRDALTTAKAVASAPTFSPTIVLQNLRRLVVLPNPSPTVGLLVGELAGQETSPQLYRLTGTGPSAALSITRHGASVTELAVSDLPGVPGAIFTIPQDSNSATNKKSLHSEFIVVSFADATLVLQVGATVEEVTNSGFLTNAPTLACARLSTTSGGAASLVQVHPAGVRHVIHGQKAKQWHCPGLKRIETASANASQVLVALAGGEVIFFQVDPMSGNLVEAAQMNIGADVCSLHVGPILPGASRSLWAAVGCRDQTVRILSLQPPRGGSSNAAGRGGGSVGLQQKASTALKSRPHSVSLVPPPPGGAAATGTLTLVIGLDDGSALRAAVDPISGGIAPQISRRFLGARPVAVAQIQVDGAAATLQLSSRPWVGLQNPNTSSSSSTGNNNSADTRHIMTPLSYMPLDHGCHFSSSAVPEGIVATSGKTLRILSMESANHSGGGGMMNETTAETAFHTQSVGLRYTPRQMTLMPVSNSSAPGNAVVLAVVESDVNAYGHEELKSLGFDPTGKSSGKGKSDDAMDMDDSDDEEDGKKDDKDDEEEDEEDKRTEVRGPIPTEAGRWGSCVRLLDPANSCRTLDVVEMAKNEAALCCCSVRFHSKGGEPLLAVGTVTGMTFHPLKQKQSHLALYRIINGDRFQLLHRTLVEDGPVLALAHFQGRLLVGIGSTLRLYEMGKRQLLRKSELRNMPSFIKTIQTVGDRAFVGDMMQSVQIVRYDTTANRMMLLANDPCPRPIVCQELLDWNTVAVSDKFGNICVLRLPKGADTGVVDLTGQRALWDTSREDMTPKMELLCQYHVGEVVTSMTRSSLVAGGAESLIYVTVTGRIGALVPFKSRDDVEFYTSLESELRTDAPRPTGRDPKSYRSYYAPAMHVVDGSLCEAFANLGHEKQKAIADKLDRSIGEISKKLEDTRSALL